MKSNKYSWHLGNTDTNCNISSCPTAPGTLWALVSTSSKLAPGTPALRGTYLHVQPSLESPGPHLNPAWFLPGCTCAQQSPGADSQPPPSKAERPGQTPSRAAATTELCQQTPSAFQLVPALYLGKLCQGESSSHLCSCGNVSCNACTSLRGAPTVQPPLHVWTRGGLENHRIRRGRDTDPRQPQAAHGRGTGQIVSTHSEKETLFYCLIWEGGETLGEAPSLILAPSPLQQTPAR